MKYEGIQTSETIRLGIVLAAAGGFMDAYSYLWRGHVFANAQTGNMLLLGIHLAKGAWGMALRYLIPVLAFSIGIAFSDVVKRHLKENRAIHWRQISILIEAIVLAIVCLFPQQMNLWANALTSLACGIQVETFRKIHGSGVATTMCVGNLRSATEHMGEYWGTKDKIHLYKGLMYYGIIISFIVGAVFGNICIQMLKGNAILVCSGILMLAFWMMFSEEKENRVDF